MWGVWRRWRSPDQHLPDDEIGEEFRDHLRRRTADLVGQGLTPDAAARRATVEFGGVENYKEQARHAARGGAGVIVFEQLWLELTCAARRLARTPVFTAFSIVSIALGVGVVVATDAVFEDGTQPIGLAEPAQVVAVTAGSAAVRWSRVLTREDAERAIVAQHGLRPAAVTMNFEGTMQVGPTAYAVEGEGVSEEYFRIVGVNPDRGRLLDSGDAAPSASPAVVIAERYWRESLGSDPNLVGSSIDIEGIAFVVAGIVPDRFAGILQPVRPFHPTQVWVPIRMVRQLRINQDPRYIINHVALFGHLAPCVSLATANAEFRQISERLDQLDPLPSDSTGGSVRREWSVRSFAELDPVSQPRHVTTIATLFVGIIALVAAMNLAMLILSRELKSQQERTIRRALGASRFRLAVPTVLEASVLVVMGGFGAALVATLAMFLLRRNVTFGPRSFYFAPRWDPSSIALLGILLLACWFISTVVPTVALRRLRSGDIGTLKRRLRVRFVVIQVAGASLFLVVSAMLGRTEQRTLAHDTGIDYSHLGVAIFRRNIPDQTSRLRLHEQAILQELGLNHDFEAVASTNFLPFGMTAPQRITIEAAGGAPVLPVDRPERVVGINSNAALFRALDISIVEGRALRDDDNFRADPNVVMSEQLARTIFGTTHALGRVLSMWSADWWSGEATLSGTVVGIAEQTDEGVLFGEPTGILYVPHYQLRPTSLVVVARTRRDSAHFVPAMRQAIERASPDLTMTSIGSGPEMLGGDYIALKPFAELMMLLGLTTLTLAMAGLYGVLSATIKQRTSELGVRLALGAEPWRVVRLVLAEGLRPVLYGLAIGCFGALLLRKLIWRHVQLTELADPIPLLVASAPLLAAAFFACYWPARRASRVDPTIVLRAE